MPKASGNKSKARGAVRKAKNSNRQKAKSKLPGVQACPLWQKPSSGDAWDQAPNPDKWRDEEGGKIYPLDDGSVIYETSDGTRVTYDKKGYPDFSPHELDRTTLKGGFEGRSKDFKKANEQTGREEFGSKSPKAGNKKCTWHHNEDGKTMQLVPYDIHKKFSHSGGISLAETEGS